MLNIGNSHTQVGLLKADSLEYIGTFSTDLWLSNSRRQLPEMVQPYADLHCVAACVVPKVHHQLSQWFGANKLVMVSPETAVKIDFSKVDAATLGADRIANAAGAIALKLAPAVIIDCGTAITLEVIDSQNRFLGGGIMPGRALQRRALHSHTAQLPYTPLTLECIPGPGRNTEDAIRFGIDTGLLGAVQRLVDECRDAGSEAYNIICTGGDAPFFCQSLRCLQPAPRFLTLHGAAAVASLHSLTGRPGR